VTATDPALGYSPNAQFWVDIIRNRRDRYRVELTDPAMLDACGDVTGLRVLDGGAGEGYLCRYLSKRGAEVSGIELDRELVKAARQLEAGEQRGIDFVHGSLYDTPWSDNTFDLVTLNHVVNDLEHLDQAHVEIARILKPGGRLVILALHPCHYWQRTGLPEDNPEWVSLYYTIRPREQFFNVAGVQSPAPVRAWYRPLESHVGALTGAGFVVTGLSEPHPSAKQLEDSWWAANWTKPMFMLLEAEKR
jgi:2-polyprenyl-3-methyl-5-hydroxy-6-metoxy-1,4-benzoquinol methylase